MTTLIESAQALVTEIKSAEVPWRIAKLLPELEQAIAQEKTNPCDTCKHRPDGYDDVCANCCNFYANHWEPKP